MTAGLASSSRALREAELICAINLSEGSEHAKLDALFAAARDLALDMHSDTDHNRSVLTLGGHSDRLLDAVRSVIRTALATLDLRSHRGLHPRFGVVDVVPFAPVHGDALDQAIAARQEIARWAGCELGVPCFLFGAPAGGEILSLPEVRRNARRGLDPDLGPNVADPRHGAMAVGARGPLVAYNLWVRGAGRQDLNEISRALRSPAMRTLAISGPGVSQVSCNLVDPLSLGPDDAYDLVAAALPRGASIVRGELVGLISDEVLAHVQRGRFEQLGLAETDTISARLTDPSLRRRRS
ncbi:MAG: hypothetical protein ACRDVP_00035 [Acidimicrobiales bacterium]